MSLLLPASSVGSDFLDPIPKLHHAHNTCHTKFLSHCQTAQARYVPPSKIIDDCSPLEQSGRKDLKVDLSGYKTGFLHKATYAFALNC